jgi:hypothetical protein
MLLMGHTERWRNQRKILHSQLNGQQAETKFIPYQELEVKHLVWDYLTRPEKFFKANQRFSNSVIVSVIFGRRARLDDEQLAIILGQMEEFGAALFSPAVAIADLFPWLERLPKSLQWWRPYGERFFLETLACVSLNPFSKPNSSLTIALQCVRARSQCSAEQDQERR